MKRENYQGFQIPNFLKTFYILILYGNNVYDVLLALQWTNWGKKWFWTDILFLRSPWRRVFHGVAILGRRPTLRLTLLISSLLVTYEAHQGQSYTDTDDSVVMLTLNSWAPRREAITTIFKFFVMTQPCKSNPRPPVL